ncbi:MAG: DinB family protein [Gemmatimonadaceae bacterium]|nr:DinB family protein [Gemmatimonadaceae bacterium]
MSTQPEWWLRGPVDGVPVALQPAAHMVLQLRDELQPHVADLTLAQWNARPAGVASIAYHVRHIAGVLDRMGTYARGALLDDAQKAALKGEGEPLVQDDRAALLARLDAQIEASLAQYRETDPATLGDVRGIGRAALPSTVIGCLMHGAEHGMRHLGQLIVTARVVRGA